MSDNRRTVRLRVSPKVARMVSEKSDRETRLRVARGDVPLETKDRITALFFLCHGADEEIRETARSNLRRLPDEALVPVLSDSDLHPKILDFLARIRIDNPDFLKQLMSHPGLLPGTLLYIARRADRPVLDRLEREELLPLDSEEIRQSLLENPRTGAALLARLSERNPPVQSGPEEPTSERETEKAVEENLSKYQLSLELGVSEKIKHAMTGDKEWRSLLIKDSNRLVSSAVLKNPRITEAEVLTIARSRSSSDELIRMITLNREWIKNYEVKKALVVHPRTPLPKALRYMSILTEKDIKMLAKSKNVSSIIVNNARRMILAKEKKG